MYLKTRFFSGLGLAVLFFCSTALLCGVSWTMFQYWLSPLSGADSEMLLAFRQLMGEQTPEDSLRSVAAVQHVSLLGLSLLLFSRPYFRKLLLTLWLLSVGFEALSWFYLIPSLDSLFNLPIEYVLDVSQTVSQIQQAYMLRLLISSLHLILTAVLIFGLGRRYAAYLDKNATLPSLATRRPSRSKKSNVVKHGDQKVPAKEVPAAE